jgi:hypothetical protein
LFIRWKLGFIKIRWGINEERIKNVWWKKVEKSSGLFIEISLKGENGFGV